MTFLWDIAADTLFDCVRLLPFLLLTYLLMEALEHRAGGRLDQAIRSAGPLGPLVGALTGAVPQCGFSAAAASLYAGNVISLGTLLAIFLTTSDELVPVFISEDAGLSLLLLVLLLKVGYGLFCGLCIDMVVRFLRKNDMYAGRSGSIEELCESERCQCEDGVWLSAIKHTLRIAVFLLAFLFLFNMATEWLGEELLGELLGESPRLAVFMAALLGLVPSCASSVFLAELYLRGILTFGAMMSGLFVNAGVGLIVLFRLNRNCRENLGILILLYACGCMGGLLCGRLPLGG